MRFFTMLRAMSSISFSRAMMFVLVSLLLGLLIWYAGPELHFGQATPLEAVGTRVAVILLVQALILFVFWKWPLSILGVTALCLLLWFGTPLIKVGDTAPFEAEWTRVLLVIAVCAGFAFFIIRDLLKKLANDPEFLQKFTKNEEGEEPEQIIEQATELENKFHRALAQLKELKVNKSLLHKLTSWNRYLYELPWYMMLGTTDSGKSTAALNSGLSFPQNEPLDAEFFAQLPATDDCDWWLSNSAVFVDPSGKYVAQEVLKDTHLSEWRTVLKLLKQHRPRTPVNGVILTLSLQELIEQDAQTLRKQATRLRLRMDEMRKEMEILFPVYLVITKTDIMRGFDEYFTQLSVKGKEQVWGFTLSHQAQSTMDSAQVKAQVHQELEILAQQLERNINDRLHEEARVPNRAKLYAFTDEFRSLGAKIEQFTAQLLVESKFDDTQKMTMLRGVYFASSVQSTLKGILANRQTVYERIKQKFSRTMAVTEPSKNFEKHETQQAIAPPSETEEALTKSLYGEDGAMVEVMQTEKPNVPPTEIAHAPTEPVNPRYRLLNTQSHFIKDLFCEVILAETHLVRPNLRWEYQNRLKKIFGNLGLGLGFLGLTAGVVTSANNNGMYLKHVADKTTALEQQVSQYQSQHSASLVPQILTASDALPQYANLRIDKPSIGYRFGLYTGEDIKTTSDQTYHKLQDNLLLPYINQRLEAVMIEGLRDKAPDKAYNALRIYLLLRDEKRFSDGRNAKDVQDWVHKDVDSHDPAAEFEGNSAIGGQIKAMFDGQRLIHTNLKENSDLIAQVRQFLNNAAPTQRLYDRAKNSMLQDAPADISLKSIMGERAAQTFSLKSGKTIDKGVSGIFTVEGYKRYFGLKLIEFVKLAQKDDAWVMGQTVSEQVSETAEQLAEQFNSPQMIEVRKLYLTDYARAWQEFVNDIQLAPDTSGGMNGFVYELTTAKALVSADSPLSRLLRTIAKETSPTAVPPTAQGANNNAVDNKVTSLKETANELQKNAQALGRITGLNDLKLERELVENPFAAIREVVTGSPYVAGDPAANMMAGATAAPGIGKVTIDSMNGLISEYYNALTTIDNASRTGQMPTTVETFAKLRMEADKYPAPINNILATMGQGGQLKLTLLMGEMLNRQFNEQVGNICWQTMAGKYPFDRGAQNEVLPEDFANLFAPNGLYSQFFQKNLANIVDANSRPWRYRLQADGTPLMGPPLDSFEQANQIRQLYFGGGSMAGMGGGMSTMTGGAGTGARMSFNMNVSVTALDPEIAQIFINIDGQGQRYAHGPIAPLNFTWPGTRGGVSAEILAESMTGGPLPPVGANGTWALFRLIDKANYRNQVSSNRLSVGYDLGGHNVLLEFSAQGINPLSANVLQTFSCPKSQPLTMPTLNASPTTGAAPSLSSGAPAVSAGALPTNPKTGKPLTVGQ